MEECDYCNETKPVHRRVTLTDGDGVLLDTHVACEECWKSMLPCVTIDFWDQQIDI